MANVTPFRKHGRKARVSLFAFAICLLPFAILFSPPTAQCLGPLPLQSSTAVHRGQRSEQPAEDHYKSGLAELQNQHWDAAIREFKLALKHQPSSAAIHTSLGWALMQKGEPITAISELREAVSLDPNLADAHFNLTCALEQIQDLDGAIRSYQDALRLRPDWAEAHDALGEILGHRGNLMGARGEFESATKLKPDDAGAHQSLAMVYRQQGDTARAQEESQKAEELNKAKMDTQAATLATNTGAQQLRRGDVEGSIRKFREALKLSPDFAPAHFPLALALRQKGELAEAEKEFKRAEQLDPHFKTPGGPAGSAPKL